MDRYINPEHKDINDFIELEGGLIAHRYDIISTSRVCYAVYERSALFAGKHTSFLSNEKYGVMGDITTRELPAELEAMRPGSQERCHAVNAWHRELEALAEKCIRSAFSEDFIVGT
ncbi:MAG TPA: hypothetical protein VHV10_05140 [Ktedonobacteraceae bacterium]|nr:hypothetical protein [Ktedonobacteraceae bacterium]